MTEQITWRKIETAPKDGTEIYCWSSVKQGFVGWVYWSKEYKSWAIKGWGPIGREVHGLKIEGPTHWTKIQGPSTD